MKKEKIIIVGIDESRRLFVKPEIVSFPFVYRAAMEVNWDEKRKVLFSPKPREWPYQRWFEQIINAVKDECNIILFVDDYTIWEKIDDNLKQEMIHKLKSINN